MLLQDIFASARPNRVSKKLVTEECSTLFVLLKLNNIIAQRKTTNVNSFIDD